MLRTLSHAARLAALINSYSGAVSVWTQIAVVNNEDVMELAPRNLFQ